MWDVLHWGGETQALIYDPRAKKVIGINALGVARDVGGEAGQQLALAARDAYVSGMTLAVLVGSVVAFVAASMAISGCFSA